MFNNPPQKWPKTFKIDHSGEISQNLVSLRRRPPPSCEKNDGKLNVISIACLEQGKVHPIEPKSQK